MPDLYVVQNHVRPDRQTHRYAGRRRLTGTRYPLSRTVASVRPVTRKVKIFSGEI
ncbi:hypothetical protein MettiDRAFT_2633 [Methanolobus tindarius DSM 2278]|uniref:Uncharacterized protein n=1 Tax=Methanolobus tindarius DSM 2278 TaxID=1090322 RepID=W9DR31_METTI|nr:hypothetical protein [Methanolobus tindarius]ETA69139.1 hypothetical protein MettiDRAFT_2633 [Methanolobus tindarius DSM 2278]